MALVISMGSEGALARAAGQRDALQSGGAAVGQLLQVIERVVLIEGQAIGEYKLLQRIDGGGMDVVFIVEQTQPISRRVVLKIIKPGMDTEQPGTDEVP